MPLDDVGNRIGMTSQRHNYERGTRLAPSLHHPHTPASTQDPIAKPPTSLHKMQWKSLEFSRPAEKRAEQAQQNNSKKVLKAFIQHDPTSEYTFDSERGSDESEICREDAPSGKECIKLKMDSKKLFKAMQDEGFFCAIPIDPTRTDIICKPLPKN